MPTLKEKLAEQIPALREEVKNLVKQYGDKEVDKITVDPNFRWVDEELKHSSDDTSVYSTRKRFADSWNSN